MNVRHMSLDINKRQEPMEPVRIRQGDCGGVTIVADVYDNGTQFDMTDMYASFVMLAPNKASYVRDTNCVIDGNTITYVMDEEHCASVVGITEVAYFSIATSQEYVASTGRFTVEVLSSAYDGAVPSESWDNAIDELIERGEQAIEDVEESSITSAAATIDANVGTPSVEVSLGEKTSLGRLISFAFHNIKGAKGDKGDKGDKGNTGDPGTVTPITTAQIDDVVSDASVTSDNALTATGLTYLWGKLKTKFASLASGVVAVTQGGTGAATHTSNAVLTGNGTSAVNNVATADGALFATAANGAASFGTLPVAQGGTGATTAAAARTGLSVPSKADLGNVAASVAPVEQSTATANHAVGSYLILDNVLYKVTTAIATGETIAEGTNVSATDLNTELTAIRDSLDGYRIKCDTLNSNSSVTFTGRMLFFVSQSVVAFAYANANVYFHVSQSGITGSVSGNRFTINNNITGSGQRYIAVIML